MGFLKDQKLGKALRDYFSVISAYSPVFSTFSGGIYEMELTRSAIHSFATHVSKLKPEIKGSAAGNKLLERRLQFQPNELLDTKKYLYRLATAYSIENNVLIAPIERAGEIRGFYPLVSSKTMFVEYGGELYVRYDMGGGQYFAVELERCGILNQYQYRDEVWGEDNRCLRPTMELIHTQNEGIMAAIKNSAAIRFIAKLVQPLKPADVEKERDYFNNFYLSKENSGGAMVIDAKYQDVKEIQSRPMAVDPQQMEQIKNNVFNYFGTNQAILQNSFTPDQWNAYYEGKIEPFALELSLVHTNMLFSEKEKAYGNQVFFSTNRLQYASLADKITFVKEAGDRGMLSTNEAREVFNLPPVEDGDIRFIRGEYKNAADDENKTINLTEGDNKNGIDQGQGSAVNAGAQPGEGE